MIKLSTKILLIACSVLLPAAGFVSDSVAADSPIIKIGLNYPETGPYAKQGLDQKRAAEIAVEEINASGGILGKKVQLVMRDTKSNAKIAKANAAELYDVEGVPMILGGSSSAVAIATGEVALQKDRLFFATLSYSTETTGEYGHRHIFRECFDAYFAGKVMADYLNKNFKGRNYFYITANYTWGWTTESVLRSFTNTKDTVKYPEILTELGAKDFKAALLEAKAHGAEVLVLSLFGRDMEIAVKQADEMGLKNRMQIIVPQMNEDMAQGAAYVILNEYKAAVERARSFETKPVIAALEGHKYTGLKDEQYWRKFDHQSIQTVYAVKVKPAAEVKKSKYQMDYFDIIATMKGDDAAVDFKEWSEIREMVNMKPELEEYGSAK